ncbi:MAG: type I glyceraldehyde-3-phosphate dehydrogenase [Sphaerospermopsis sp. SIO1G2]|nr:type I glyceraldehyde-3-phosphate dehydrogenase [Sphaerospermopsis sp. SIO1G2]
MVTIGINGLGRIGRSVLRALEEQGYHDIKVAAVNDLAPIDSLVHLLKYDSVHGRFPGAVEAHGQEIRFGRQTFVTTQERNPADIGWDTYGVDIVLECTGLFTSKEKSQAHLDGGAKRVILSAPPKDDAKTVVYGVNHETIADSDLVISNGSCTTNCLAPLAKTLHDAFGIESGFMTTVHSYTNDQNIVDAGHADLRRARAAAMSMIPTSTGAAKALGAVLPELSGKLDGTAIRVPTPNVSIVDLTFVAEQSLTKEAIASVCSEAANGALKHVMEVVSEPLVSIDFTHNPHSSIVDLTSIYVTGDRLGRIASWYDNEWGFSCRMLEVARYLAERSLAQAA